MMNVKEIRTKNKGVKIGDTIVVDTQPVALVKNGKKMDTLTLDEFASQLYGRKVTCKIEEAV